jgi:NADH-quinone oxidoreductase subunit E
VLDSDVATWRGEYEARQWRSIQVWRVFPPGQRVSSGAKASAGRREIGHGRGGFFLDDDVTFFERAMMTETIARQAESISGELLAEIEEVITHYPVSKRSASLPVLHLWQNHFGFIDDSGIEWIAAKLDLEPVNIYELVTFYPWFRRAPAGKTIIRVCRTLSCAMAGSYAVREQFCEAAGIDPHEEHHGFGDAPPTSADGKFSVEFVECLASCGTAPVCLINDDLVENVSPSDVAGIVKRYDEAPNT